jgi:hypothetical protein
MAREIDEQKPVVGAERFDLFGEQSAVLRCAVHQGEPGLRGARARDYFEVRHFRSKAQAG